MPADLRSLWPSLTPRERDAHVAKALGLKLWESRLRVGGERDVLQTLSSTAPGSSWCSVPFAELLPEGDRHGPHLLPYSTTWEHAGGLLDKLREEGWQADLRCRPDQWGFHGFLPQPGGREDLYLGCFAASGPEAIALAFCLAKEVPDAAQ